VEALEALSSDKLEAAFAGTHAYVASYRYAEDADTTVSFWMRAFIAQTSATEFFVRCTRYDESGIAVARAERAASNQELIVINRRTWEDANANEWSIHSLDSFADSSRAA
jgi:hypothetical protein